MFAVEFYDSPFYKRSRWLQVTPGALICGPKTHRTVFASEAEAQPYLSKSWPNGYKAKVVEI